MTDADTIAIEQNHARQAVDVDAGFSEERPQAPFVWSDDVQRRASELHSIMRMQCPYCRGFGSTDRYDGYQYLPARCYCDRGWIEICAR